jgi:MFS family permease
VTAASPQTSPTPVPTDPTDDGIFGRRFLLITIGACALVFLGAFESLAVTTIMPLVSAELDGEQLYALAFAGPLAVSVIGMVAAGSVADRIGPVQPLLASVALFIVGLLLAGTATTMWTLVAGRLVQSLGSGAMTVALYVLVARIYPPALHPRIFAGFAAAWVVPSLIGPFLAGVVAEQFTWHWVFLGVVGLVVIATVLLLPALRMLRAAAVERADRQAAEAAATGGPTAAPGSTTGADVRRLGWAVLVAAAVLAVNVSTEFSGWTAWLLPIVGAVVALLALRPLVPLGTLTARRGLPTVILVRGLTSAAFFGAEVYVPYLLTREHGLTPALAGLALTGGAIAWSVSSWLQGRLGDRLSNANAVQIGSSLVTVAVAVALLAALLGLPPVIPIAAWVVSGGGMGLMFPRLSVMTLAYSDERSQGFNSAAMSIGDAIGGALALAATGLAFTALDGSVGLAGAGWVASGGVAFAGCFAIALLAGVAAVIVARRVRRPEPSDTHA